MKKLLCVILLWCNASSSVFSAEQSAKFENDVYYLNATFEVESNVEDIVRLLTDFENIAQLHPSIIESELLPSLSEDKSRIRTVVKDCVLFFCKEIVRVENVFQQSNESLEAEVVPFLSDFRSGYTKWDFQQQGKLTTVMYQATMQPKFWIPPIIRSHTVTKKLETRIMEMIKRIQDKAPNYSPREE
jgi:Polyketide cyclase / dehydrase and lipid transport.